MDGDKQQDGAPAIEAGAGFAPGCAGQEAFPPPTGGAQASFSSASGERLRPHSSYVWLEGLRAVPPIFVASVGALVAAASDKDDSTVFSDMPFETCVLASLLITAVLVGVALVFRAVSYRFVWYEFGKSEFSFHSGVFVKKHEHVPYQKVQSVNERATFLQRLLGLCRVCVDTAGGAANMALTVDYLEKSAAERIRYELFARKNLMEAGCAPEQAEAHVRAHVGEHAASGGAAPLPPLSYASGEAPASGGPGEDRACADAAPACPASGNVLDAPAGVLDGMRGVFARAEMDTGAVSVEYGLSNKELLLAAITGRGSFALVAIGAIAALSSAIGFIAQIRLVASEDAVYDAAFSLFSSGAWGHAAAVASVLVFFVVIWAIVIVGSCLSLGGFRVRRRGDRIEVEHGMVTHTFSGMDVARIQSIEVRQTLFQRLLRSCSLSYGRVGAQVSDGSNSSASSEEDRLVVHPFLPLDDAVRMIETLTPEFSDLPQANRRVPRRALRRAITRRAVLQGSGFWLLAIMVCLYAAFSAFAGSAVETGDLTQTEYGVLALALRAVIVLALVIVIVDAVGAVLWYRRSGLGWDRSAMVVVNGGYSVATTYVPRSKMQMAALRANPLQRRARVASVSVRTAAGTAGRTERLIDVDLPDARVWLSWAEPGGASRS